MDVNKIVLNGYLVETGAKFQFNGDQVVIKEMYMNSNGVVFVVYGNDNMTNQIKLFDFVNSILTMMNDLKVRIRNAVKLLESGV